MKKQIQVFLVEDSPVAQLFLVQILNSDPRLHVMGTAESGENALEFLNGNHPDVIVMDIYMGGMDGFETTRRIMESQPVPIVVCTGSYNTDEVAMNFRAMQAGAVALVAKPPGLHHGDYEKMAGKLVETVRLMSEVKVVKRWPRPRSADAKASVPILPREPGSNNNAIVAIGTSTGGPPVLQTILAGLPRDFPLPLLIVQHIAAGFLPGLAEWLSQSTCFPVHIATHGEPLSPGRAYLAPDGFHMGLSANRQICLSKKEPEGGLRPSVAHLFRSLAKVCGGSAAAVLLTGMGKDGALELKHLKDLGALTIAQDEESSIVYGMPGEAIRLGAAQYILPPEKIARMLAGLGAKSRVS